MSTVAPARSPIGAAVSAALLAAAAAILPAASADAADRGASEAALAEAAQATILADIDWNERQCESGRTVAAWLGALTAGEVAAIRWYGGACRLANADNPIDSGGGPCGGAEIRLKRPNDADDVATIEIYFEAAKHGRPGKPFAFRGSMEVADGWDYTRWSADFEADWRSRFPDAGGPRCTSPE